MERETCREKETGTWREIEGGRERGREIEGGRERVRETQREIEGGRESERDRERRTEGNVLVLHCINGRRDPCPVRET